MKLTSKGQVTIPQALREQFGLHPDTEVTFEATPDGVLIKRAAAARRRQLEAGLRRARGSSTTRRSTQEIMNLTRGDD
ncbi:MAG TPA: AbrB/MazE/SpoVT family DNA-binding domain-containing protein [Opitutaceae bacterium]